MDLTYDSNLIGRVQSSVGFSSQLSNCTGMGKEEEPEIACNCFRPVVELRDNWSANFARSLDILGRWRMVTVHPR
jgi:hypothetical protein